MSQWCSAWYRLFLNVISRPKLHTPLMCHCDVSPSQTFSTVLPRSTCTNDILALSTSRSPRLVLVFSAAKVRSRPRRRLLPCCAICVLTPIFALFFVTLCNCLHKCNFQQQRRHSTKPTFLGPRIGIGPPIGVGSRHPGVSCEVPKVK